MRVPLRLRLTIVFTLSMLVLLAVAGTFVYLRLGSELLRTTDTALLSQANAVAAGIGQQQGQTFNEPMPIGSGHGLTTFTQVLGPASQVIEFSSKAAGRPVLPPSALAGVHRTTYLTQTVRGIAGKARLVVLPETDGGQPVWIIAGASLRSRSDVLSAMLALLLIGGTVTLALAAGIGWVVAGAALRPVERMRREADAIAAADRGRRLPVPATRDEVERLGNTLNAMLDRLEAAFDRERRLVDDASHELRTPLAILKAELDLARSKPRTRQELRKAVDSAAGEADRLTSLAETLLIYSRTEGGRMPLSRERTELDRLLGEACSAFAARAAAAGVTVRVDPHHVTAAVDPVRVRQAVENLVSNALAHTEGGGEVRVSAVREDGAVRLTVRDTGAGFDPGFLPHAFEPFATGPAPANGDREGAGLGLAIVQAIAQAHGGLATAENQPDGGARVTLLLPAAS